MLNSELSRRIYPRKELDIHVFKWHSNIRSANIKTYFEKIFVKHMHPYHHMLLRVVCILLFCLCRTNATADDQNHAPLSIRVGAYENQPKIYTDESGKTVGLFPDILSYVALKEGWRLTYVHGTWRECLENLEKNNIDLMVDVAYSKDRAEKFLFTHETFMVNWGIVYTQKEQNINSFIDLNGKKIAVMRGSIHTEGDSGIKHIAAQFDINCSFIEVDNYQEVFSLLSDKKADAGIVNRVFGSLFSEAYAVLKTPIIFNPRQLRFALPRQSALSPLLIEKLDQYLHDLKKSPHSIYNKAIYVYLSGLPRELIFSDPDVTPPSKKVILNTDEKKWIQAHPVIRLGIDPEFAPFEFISSTGVYRGIASDYIKLLNQRLGINMQVTETHNWKKNVEKIKAKKIDILPCVSITHERQAFLKFSKSYLHFYRVIVTGVDTPFLTGLEDIEPLKVAVQKQTSHEGFLRENTSITPISYDTLQKALLSVSDGENQAFVGNLTSSTYWIRKLNLTNLKVAAPVSQEVQTLHFGVRSDWPELLGILNKGLSSITEQEENAIRNKYIKIDYTPGISLKVFWKRTFQIAGAAFSILLIIIFWNYRLQKEIQKRNEMESKLFEANKNLKKLDQLKSMFIASMSHELRTPLNSIIGFTGIILQGMTGPLNEKQQDHLGRVSNAAKHLLSLITDVIDISKIEAGRIDTFFQDFLLSDIVDEAVFNVAPQIKAKALTLEISIPQNLTLHTDRKRLLQCIINYLSNAAKYTEAGKIKLTAERLNEKIQIAVTDTGIGISKKDQPKLFQAFERLDSHLRVKAGGTGLGLYLTRKLVTEILKGEVYMHSQKHKGSTFGIIIPIHMHTSNDGLEIKYSKSIRKVETNENCSRH